VDFVDACIDEDATTVQVLPATPTAGLEVGLFLHLDQPQIPNFSSFHHSPAFLNGSHEPVVFCNHQGHLGLLGCVNDLFAFCKGTSDGLLYQDVLSSMGRETGVF
jgi:hypothetical protein